MNETELNGKVAFVTGATSGIGRACAIAFANAGAKVVCVGRKEDALRDVEKQIREIGAEALTIRANLADPSEARQAVDRAIQAFGGIDVLVNAAGHLSNGTIENTSLQAWDDMMDVNVRAPFQLMQMALPSLIERRGNIVNVSSVTGLRAFPGVLAYCVSKAALDQLTRCSSLELAAKGVRVNAVNPGVVVTEIHKRGGMNDDAYAAFLEHSKTTHPIGRTGRPEEIASLVLYLASDQASWITGATYSIDGGRSQTCAR
ncbi:MAG TPA: glucose 1-dehydrogenase [Pyrinomonadaceae bacterium]|nr:glucose 1-dehydrogenase [Pyrinomonadaceae bacterium]